MMMNNNNGYNNSNEIPMDFEPSCSNNQNNACELRIVLQPKSIYRLRYIEEGNHGVITHKQSEDESVNGIAFKFPKVRFQTRYKDRIFYILVSLHNFENKGLSPHLLMCKDEDEESYDFIFEEMAQTPLKDFTWELQNYTIIRCKEEDYQFSLDEKEAAYEDLKLPMNFIEIKGSINVNDAKSLKKCTSLNVCLGFTIFEKVDKVFKLLKATTFSDGIFHGDSFKIQKICGPHGSFKSSTEITLLTNFKPKFPMKILMYKNEWRKEIEIENTDLNTPAITFQAPPYVGQYLNEDIEVYLEVVVGDLYYKSNTDTFLYKSQDLAEEDKNSLVIYKICNTEGYINEETEVTLLIKIYTNCSIQVIMYTENPETLEREWSARIPITNEPANEMVFNQSAITFKAPLYRGKILPKEDIRANVQVLVTKGDLQCVSNSVTFLYKQIPENTTQNEDPLMELQVPTTDSRNYDPLISYPSTPDIESHIDDNFMDFILNPNLENCPYQMKYTIDIIMHLLEKLKISEIEELSKNAEKFQVPSKENTNFDQIISSDIVPYPMEHTIDNMGYLMEKLEISNTKKLATNADQFNDLSKQLVHKLLVNFSFDRTIHHALSLILSKLWPLINSRFKNSDEKILILSKFFENFKFIVSAAITTNLPSTIDNCDNNCILKIQLLLQDSRKKTSVAEFDELQMFEIRYRKSSRIWPYTTNDIFTILMDTIINTFEQTGDNALDSDFWESSDLAKLIKLIRYYVFYYPKKPMIDLPHALKEMLEHEDKVWNHLNKMINNVSYRMSPTFRCNPDLLMLDLCYVGSQYEPIATDNIEYNMNHKKRGLALIFNHEYFDNPALKRRQGTNADCVRLGEALKYLDFEVSFYHECKRLDIMRHIKNAAAQDHSDRDCIVIAILTHGAAKGYLHAKDLSYHISEILQKFSSQNCPTLAGKPKIFFIQACLDVDEEISSAENYRIPVPVDCLVVDSKIPVFKGGVDQPNIPAGSWFIQALADELMVNSSNLVKLLRCVNGRVANNIESAGPAKYRGRQPKTCISSMLTRTIRFYGKTESKPSNIELLEEMAYKSIVIIVSESQANEDVKTITDTFKTLFNAEVFSWCDLSTDGLKKNMNGLKTNPEWLNKLSNCKFIAIFYLTDGQDYSELRDIHTIKKVLVNPLFKIKELDKKLKWLVVKACRGNFTDFEMENEELALPTAKACRENLTDYLMKYPVATTSRGYLTEYDMDFDMNPKYYLDYYCICYTAIKDFKSYEQSRRNKYTFIEDLCRELERNAKTETLVNMLATVNRFAKTRNHFENMMYACNSTFYNFFK